MAVIAVDVADMARVGPIMPIRVIPPAKVVELLKKAERPLPKPIDARVMIDTGAERSCVRKGLLGSLELTPIGSGQISTASDKQCDVLIYQVRFLYISGQWSRDLSVSEVPELAGGLDGLLGRDILSTALFVYDGGRNQFSFAI